MRFVSTAGSAPAASLREAVLAGLAPDGGLYQPDPLPRLAPDAIATLPGGGLARVASLVGSALFDDLDSETREGMLGVALDFPIPLVPLGERVFVLELTHGPTLAFKDVGARVLARLLLAVAPADERPLTVLTATSGDTGGAVAQAFHGLSGVRVDVLYPVGQVSPLQERQFTTLGGNVRAWAVRGTFDDCQRMAKAAFADRAMRAAHRLTSANSINVGRLLPQILPYFHAWAQLPQGAGEVVVSVPSGNFGNLCAGAMATRMGLPIRTLLAATNANDVVPQYLLSGRYEPRPSVRTISSAMDVGSPGNFQRLLALYGGAAAAMREDIVGSAHGDDATREAIRAVYEGYGYVMDPHTAVGYLALEQELTRRSDARGILLATAHPAKFAEIVEPVTGVPVEVPERLRAGLGRPSGSVELDPHPEALRDALRA